MGSPAPSLSPSLRPLMQLVCTWSGIPYPTSAGPGPGPDCVASAENAVARAHAKLLARSQRERVQIVALVECVQRCFAVDEISCNLPPVLVALAAVVTGTAKNRVPNRDVVAGLAQISDPLEFRTLFSTYASADAWLQDCPTRPDRDVFGEFTWTKMRKNGKTKC